MFEVLWNIKGEQTNKLEKTIGIIIRVFLVGMLVFNSWVDIRKKEISIWAAMIMGCLGLGLQIFGSVYSGRSAWRLWPGVLLGGVILLMVYFLRKIIGFGDGIMIFCCFLFLTISSMLGALFIAGCACGLFALFMILVKRKGKNYELPFLPFLTLGVLAETIWGEMLWNVYFLI